jgi:hypothetical protein
MLPQLKGAVSIRSNVDLVANPYSYFMSGRGVTGATMSQARGSRRLLPRESLFLSVATIAILAVPPDAAQANCVATGPELDCTGDVSAGVSVTNSSYTTLNVNGLGKNITPAANTPGIAFKVTDPGKDITIDSNTGSYSIVTTGPGNLDRGIYGYSKSGSVSITSVGNITAATGNAILGEVKEGSGNVVIKSTGDVAGNRNALPIIPPASSVAIPTIHASAVDGNASIYSSGDVYSRRSRGLHAAVLGMGQARVVSYSGYIKSGQAGILVRSDRNSLPVATTGSVYVNNSSKIYAFHDSDDSTYRPANAHGIRATTDFGTVTIKNSGAITSKYASGIFAESRYGGAITITNSGTAGITANSNSKVSGALVAGILARSLAGTGSGNGIDIINSSAGTIETTFNGIYALNSVGAVTVSNASTINARLDGIFGKSSGNAAVTITSTGNITSAAQRAIYAYSKSGSVTVNALSGSITSDGAAGGEISTSEFAQGQGIFAGTMGSGNVTVTGGAAINTMNAASAKAHGIHAYSKLGNVSVDFTGNVKSMGASAILAAGGGNLSVTVGGPRRGRPAPRASSSATAT